MADVGLSYRVDYWRKISSEDYVPCGKDISPDRAYLYVEGFTHWCMIFDLPGEADKLKQTIRFMLKAYAAGRKSKEAEIREVLGLS